MAEPRGRNRVESDPPGPEGTSPAAAGYFEPALAVAERYLAQPSLFRPLPLSPSPQWFQYSTEYRYIFRDRFCELGMSRRVGRLHFQFSGPRSSPLSPRRPAPDMASRLCLPEYNAELNYNTQEGCIGRGLFRWANDRYHWCLWAAGCGLGIISCPASRDERKVVV